MVVEAVDDRGAILTDAISAGASTELTKDFTTVRITRLIIPFE